MCITLVGCIVLNSCDFILISVKLQRMHEYPYFINNINNNNKQPYNFIELKLLKCKKILIITLIFKLLIF